MANIALTPRMRVRLMAPRSVDPTEATVLTPAAGAPHSDPFLVATAQGVSDGYGTYKPYLEFPNGQRGQMDALTCVRSIGSWTWRVLDKRTTVGGSDLTRWVTAFFGDAAGRAQCLGLKWVAEVDWGDGNGWVGHSTGRVQYIDPDDSGALRWQFTVRETTDELHRDIFVGKPHASATAASTTKLWPVWYNGITYGPWTAISPPVKARMTVASSNGQYMSVGMQGGGTTGNIITKALTTYLSGNWLAPPLRTARVRMAFVTGAGGLNGQTKEYWLGAGGSVVNSAIVGGTQFQMFPLDASDPMYAATVPVNATADVEIYAWGAPTADGPLYIGDIHPGQLIKDILDGYYGYFYATGAVYTVYPYDTTAMAAIIADTSFASARFTIDKVWDAKDFIEQQILTAFGLGYYEDATGKLVLYDARPPVSLAGLVTLTSADYRADSLRWQHGRAAAITQFTVGAYIDSPVVVPGSISTTQPMDMPPALISPREQLYQFLDFGRLDMGQKAYKLDATGLRTSPLGTDMVGNTPRSAWLYAYIQTLADQYKRPYAAGSMTLTGSFRRTANVTGLHEGSLVLVNVIPLPDPTSNQRAGTRLMRAVQMTPGADGAISLALLDMGRSVAAAVPVTVGTPTADGTDTTQLVDVAITLNAASDRADVWYNATATSVGTRPVDSDPGWTYAGNRTSTGTLLFSAPGSRRIWVRARSNPSVASQLQPSAWQYPVGTGYVDLATLTAPSGVGVTPSGYGAMVTWTAGAATAMTEVSLDNFATRLVLLQIGVTSVSIGGLALSTGYTVYLRHIGVSGALSAITSQAFTTTGTPNVCPAMSGLQIIVGGLA